MYGAISGEQHSRNDIVVTDVTLNTFRQAANQVGFRNKGKVLFVVPFALALNRILLNKVKRLPQGISTIGLKYYQRSTWAQFTECDSKGLLYRRQVRKVMQDLYKYS